MRFRISSCVTQIIRQAAADAHPFEACGLLFGQDDAITAAQVTENVTENKERQFEIDPAALFAALRAERAGGPKILGYWHSHPSGEATPSVTDAAMAAPDGRLWLIVAGEAAALWRASEGGAVHQRFDPITFDVD